MHPSSNFSLSLSLLSRVRLLIYSNSSLFNFLLLLLFIYCGYLVAMCFWCKLFFNLTLIIDLNLMLFFPLLTQLTGADYSFLVVFNVWHVHFMSQSFLVLLLGADNLSSATKCFNKCYEIVTLWNFGSIYVSNPNHEKQQRTNVVVEVP